MNIEGKNLLDKRAYVHDQTPPQAQARQTKTQDTRHTIRSGTLGVRGRRAASCFVRLWPPSRLRFHDPATWGVQRTNDTGKRQVAAVQQLGERPSGRT